MQKGKATLPFEIRYSPGIGKLDITVVAELTEDGLKLDAYASGNMGFVEEDHEHGKHIMGNFTKFENLSTEEKQS